MSSDFHKNHHVTPAVSNYRTQEKPTSANNNNVSQITENTHKNNNNNNNTQPSGSNHANKPVEKTKQPNNIQKNLWGSRSVDVFDKIEAIGEGTFGEVFMARSKENGDIVALKRIRMEAEKEGFPITAIREIKILKELQHDNVVQLKEIVTEDTKDNKANASVFMVFEYMDHDLAGLLMTPQFRPTAPQIKCYMKQLLEGLHHCHSKGVMHRDIKCSNLLVNNKGQLKLADFGLARTFSETNSQYTNRVITLWYRPPELLLGSVHYGPAIDMWSAGCILAELLLGKALFPGKNEIEELETICKLCGSPNEENWPGVTKLPWYNMMKLGNYRRCLREQYSHWDNHALDLVDKLLTLDPSKRLSALDALDHDYFWTDPIPCEPSALPKYHEASHELQAKKRRQQQQAGPMKRPRPVGPMPPNQFHQHPDNRHPGHPGQHPHPPHADHRGPHPDQRYQNGRPPQHPSHPPHPHPHQAGPHVPPPNNNNNGTMPPRPPRPGNHPPIHRAHSDNKPPLPSPLNRGGPPPPRQGYPPHDRDRRQPPPPNHARENQPHPPKPDNVQ